MSANNNRTAEDILADLKALRDRRDFDCAHVEADGLMMEFARIMGRQDIAEAFDAVGKWYA